MTAAGVLLNRLVRLQRMLRGHYQDPTVMRDDWAQRCIDALHERSKLGRISGNGARRQRHLERDVIPAQLVFTLFRRN